MERKEAGIGEGVNLSHLPSFSASLAPELNPSFVVPKQLLSQLLASNLRLEKILANPYSHLLEQIEIGIRRILEDSELSMEEKNRRYSNLLAFQAKVKDGMSEAQSWSLPQMPPRLEIEARMNDEGEGSEASIGAITRSQSLDPSQRALLISVPNEQRSRAEELLIQLKRWPNIFAMNESGNLMIDGNAVNGSNMSDILSLVFKQTPPGFKTDPASYWKRKMPTGSEAFIRAYARTSLGSSLIRNDYLADRLQALRENSSNQMNQQAAHRLLSSSPTLHRSFPSPASFANFTQRYKTLREEQYQRQPQQVQQEITPHSDQATISSASSLSNPVVAHRFTDAQLDAAADRTRKLKAKLIKTLTGRNDPYDVRGGRLPRK